MLSLKGMQTLKACTENESIHSRQSTSRVLFQPANVYGFSILKGVSNNKSAGGNNI